MGGTFTTALLLAVSSQRAAASNQLDPRQWSLYNVKLSDQLKSQSSPRGYLRRSQEPRVDWKPFDPQETRTIEQAMTEASETIAAVARPRFDLNFPPSETLALLSEGSELPPRKHAPTSTVHDLAVATSRSSNPHLATTQARLDSVTPVKLATKRIRKRAKEPLALKMAASLEHVREDQSTVVVDTMYTMYLDHLRTSSMGFDPTREETVWMLRLLDQSFVDSPNVFAMYNNNFKRLKDEDLNVLTNKLGTRVTSTLTLLASLGLSLEATKEVQHAFVWHASLVRWRAMYYDFLKFCKVHSDALTTSLPGVKLFREGTDDAVSVQLEAEVDREKDPKTIGQRVYRLSKSVKAILAKHHVKNDVVATVEKAVEGFLANGDDLVLERLTALIAAFPPSNQLQRQSRHESQVSKPAKDTFHVLESSALTRRKRPRSVRSKRETQRERRKWGDRTKS